jgi:hypothetical protein
MPFEMQNTPGMRHNVRGLYVRQQDEAERSNRAQEALEEAKIEIAKIQARHQRNMEQQGFMDQLANKNKVMDLYTREFYKMGTPDEIDPITGNRKFLPQGPSIIPTSRISKGY